MLNIDYNNGKKLNLLNALALFTVIMGLLFWIAATPGASTVAAVSLIIFGSVWFIACWLYDFHRHHPSH
ncbi:MAG: hypothetical protein V7707_10595 [Motiliproteus sp.]